MSKKTLYTVGDLDLNLKSNTNTITISKGDILEFEPEATTKNLETEVFNVCLTQGINKLYFKSKGAIVQRIIDNSTKKIVNYKEELFEFDSNQETFNELAHKLYLKQNSLLKMLSKVDLASNSQEIVGIIESLIKTIKPLIPEIDFNNLTKEQEKSLKAIDNLNFELSCPNKNIVSTQNPYKYLPKMEKFALSNLEDAIKWLNRDKDIYMNHATLQDFVDIVNISSLLNSGELKKCREKISNLDTYIRDGIDGQFWDEWVCTVQFNKSDLLAQQEQYDKIINNTTNKTAKKAKMK